jgi:hypothetical protein
MILEACSLRRGRGGNRRGIIDKTAISREEEKAST